MAFTCDSLKAYRIADAVQRITPDDCILYSLSVGLGSDPLHAGQLRYVYEDGLRANPMMANVIGYPGFWMRAADTGVDWKRVLHGEQFLEIHRPLPTEGEVVGRSRVVAVNDRGPEKGARVHVERVVSDVATAEPVCTVLQTSVCRGNGGCGGDDPAPKTVSATPERRADECLELDISPQSALVYRLNGDRNPLHVDPEVARHAGYPRPILHGLCTLGHAGHALLAAACDYDAARFRSLSVRFTAPVFPGERLRVELWQESGGVAFRASVAARNAVVLGNGFAGIA